MFWRNGLEGAEGKLRLDRGFAVAGASVGSPYTPRKSPSAIALPLESTEADP